MEGLEVRFGTAFTETFDKLSDAALKALFENFIEPLRRGAEISQLPGKYKPSWEVPDFGTRMQFAFQQVSQEKNLHHYHVGYKFYRNGSDPKYPGKVSDGIAHTMVLLREDPRPETHVILRLDESHPSPFTIPMDFRFN